MANDLETHGTFESTGQSGTVKGGKVLMALDFAGTATVALQYQMPSGAWVTVEEYTADAVKLFDAECSMSNLRLNCTAHTNDVEYSLSRADLG